MNPGNAVRDVVIANSQYSQTSQTENSKKKMLRCAFVLTHFFIALNPVVAAPLNFPNYPLLGGGMPPTPNVLIMYDNSVSMDGKMRQWYFMGGGDPESRSNIARNALRSVLNQHRTKFNWGLGSFETYGSYDICTDNNGRCGLYADLEGDATSMVFTNTCVNGRAPLNGNLKCIANPEPENGYNYITYANGGLDGGYSWMAGSFYKNWAWAVYGVGSTSGFTFSLFDHRNPATTTWFIGDDNSTSFGYGNDFKDPFFGPGSNSVTWSGCIDGGDDDCAERSMSRHLWMKIGWMFVKNYTGMGTIIEDVRRDSHPNHFSRLLEALAPEQSDLNSREIKNGSSQTPLMGSFITARTYFSNRLDGHPTPIKHACQKSYVLLVTDGEPTARADGTLYTPAQMSSADTGRAYTDIYGEIDSLRNISYSGNTHDIKTYVLGLGDDLLSSGIAVRGLNKMAEHGGTERAYLANNASAVSTAFQSIIGDMEFKIPLRQSNGRIALSNPAVVQNTQIYKATFSNMVSNIWEGNVLKNTPRYSTPGNGPVEYDTGEITGFDTGAARWLRSNTVNNNPRQIITAVRQDNGRPISGAAFAWSSLSAYMQNQLLEQGDNATVGSRRLSYLRGERTHEAPAGSTNGFRRRDATVLGDIIDSSPVFVGPAQSGFSDSDFPTGTPSFSTFSQSMYNRRPMVYVGANDGMLHGFDANTLQEVFAFIPNSVFSKLKLLSNPDYAHEFYVNETPLIAETIVAGRGWTTQLIGFPGMGGTGLFALDVTSPGNTRASVDLTRAESNAGNIVLWELNSGTDGDIGHILNRGQTQRERQGVSMQVGKMANGRTAILTGNGYNSPNNSTGLVIVYLDVAGGTPAYKKIMVAGATGGLSTPNPVDTDFDGKIDYAYAGDLQGNVWRFTLKGPENTWGAFKLFQANLGTPAKISPITTAPAVTYHCSKPGLMVLVGTGKYLEDTDSTSDAADYMFGLWDKLDNSAITPQNLTVQSYLQGNFQNANPAPEVARSLIITTNNTVNWNGGSRGWMLQLYNPYPKTARVIVSPYVENEMVYFNTISPNSSTCGANTSWSTTQALQSCTGQRPQRGVFDISYDGKIDSHDQYSLDGAPVYVTGVNVQDQGRIVDASVWVDAKVFTCATPPCEAIETSFNDLLGIGKAPFPTQRLSWRELSEKF